MKCVVCLIMGTVLLVLVGCGIAQSAEDTLEQTRQMNQKMDQTNQKMEQTNQKMDQTNQKIDTTNKKMDKTNDGIDKTNAAVHTQTLSVALNAMLSGENSEVLTPPTDMIPYAEKFAEEATPKEILETFHLLYTSVLKGFDAEANGDKKIKRRQVRLTAASALAALTTVEKAKQILTEQIEQEGEYLDTAYVFALCRYNFTRDFLLKPKLAADRTVTLKLLESAKENFTVLKELATVGYVEKLKVKIPEFIVVKDTNELVTMEDFLNPTEFKGLGRAAIRKFDDKTNPKMQTPEAQALIQSFK